MLHNAGFSAVAVYGNNQCALKDQNKGCDMFYRTFSSFIPIILLEMYSTLLFMVAYLKNKKKVTSVTLCDVCSAPLKFSSHFHVEDSRVLGRVAVLLGEHFPAFGKIVLPGFVTQLHSTTLCHTPLLFPCIP